MEAFAQHAPLLVVECYNMASVRSVVIALTPNFGVCSGERPGGHFIQYEAWEAREVVISNVTRTVKNVGDIKNGTR